jgi:hypothetical protein
MTIYTKRTYIIDIILQLQHIDKKRKKVRKEAGKILRENSDLIKDKVIRHKVKNGYFKDLVDQRVVKSMSDLLTK